MVDGAFAITAAAAAVTAADAACVSAAEAAIAAAAAAAAVAIVFRLLLARGIEPPIPLPPLSSPLIPLPLPFQLLSSLALPLSLSLPSPLLPLWPPRPSADPHHPLPLLLRPPGAPENGGGFHARFCEEPGLPPSAEAAHAPPEGGWQGRIDPEAEAEPG